MTFKSHRFIVAMAHDPIFVRPVQPEDVPAWEQMRRELWPSGADDHAAEIAQYLDGKAREPHEVILAFSPRDEAVGFAELSFRRYAGGCASERILYLEGWYVEPQWRRKGVGALLIRAAENWGRAQGCTEFASDALLDNEISHQAHRATGFSEVERIVCYRKDLSGPSANASTQAQVSGFFHASCFSCGFTIGVLAPHPFRAAVAADR